MVIKICMYVFFTVGANLMIRYSSMVTSPINISFLGIKFNLFTLMGILFYGCGFAFLLYLLQNNKLTYIAPIAAVLVNGFIIIGAVILFKESLTMTQSIGIALAIGSIVLLTI